MSGNEMEVGISWKRQEVWRRASSKEEMEEEMEERRDRRRGDNCGSQGQR